MMIRDLDKLASRLVPASVNAFDLIMKSCPEELVPVCDLLANAYNAVVSWYHRYGVEIDEELDLHD